MMNNYNSKHTLKGLTCGYGGKEWVSTGEGGKYN